MTSFKIRLADEINGEASRRKAVDVYQEVDSLLKQFDCIEIDLADVSFTPSVADEVIGQLAVSLGTSFKQRIKVLHASPSQMALMKHVIARRMLSYRKSA